MVHVTLFLIGGPIVAVALGSIIFISTLFEDGQFRVSDNITDLTPVFTITGIALLVFLLFSTLAIRSLNKNERKLAQEAHHRYKIEKPRYDAAIKKWERLYYCDRDGTVFDPLTGKTCLPNNISQFAYEPD